MHKAHLFFPITWDLHAQTSLASTKNACPDTASNAHCPCQQAEHSNRYSGPSATQSALRAGSLIFDHSPRASIPFHSHSSPRVRSGAWSARIKQEAVEKRVQKAVIPRCWAVRTGPPLVLPTFTFAVLAVKTKANIIARTLTHKEKSVQNMHNDKTRNRTHIGQSRLQSAFVHDAGRFRFRCKEIQAGTHR